MNLPARIDEIDAAADEMAASFEERMTAASSFETLKGMLCDHLQRGLVEMLTAIRWADEGDDMAHQALMRVYAETVNRHERPTVVLEAYIIKTLATGPVTRKQGHLWRDNWTRDIGIAVVVYAISKQFGINRTRNREQRRQGYPSASAIIAAALGRRHVNVREKTVENVSGRLNGQVAAYVLARVPK